MPRSCPNCVEWPPALRWFSERQVLTGEQRLCPGILQHVVDALLWVFRVDGDVGRACLEHTDDCRQKFLLTPHADGDEAVFLNALSDEVRGYAVRGPVQLSIGIAAIFVRYGLVVRRPGCLCFEQVDPGPGLIIRQSFALRQRQHRLKVGVIHMGKC